MSTCRTPCAINCTVSRRNTELDFDNQRRKGIQPLNRRSLSLRNSRFAGNYRSMSLNVGGSFHDRSGTGGSKRNPGGGSESDRTGLRRIYFIIGNLQRFIVIPSVIERCFFKSVSTEIKDTAKSACYGAAVRTCLNKPSVDRVFGRDKERQHEAVCVTSWIHWTQLRPLSY